MLVRLSGQQVGADQEERIGRPDSDLTAEGQPLEPWFLVQLVGLFLFVKPFAVYFTGFHTESVLSSMTRLELSSNAAIAFQSSGTIVRRVESWVTWTPAPRSPASPQMASSTASRGEN